MLQGNEFAFGRRAEPHALLSAGAMTHRLEHHLAADHQFDRFAQLPRGSRGERTLRPWPQLAAETGADEFRDDAHVLLGQAKHLREHSPQVDDSLRRFVEGQSRAIPSRGRGVQLDGVVRLGRRDISLIELDGRGCESAIGVAALVVQAAAHAEGGGYRVRILVRVEARFDVRLLLRVRRVDRIGSGLGGLERFSHSQRNVLAVITNDVVLEWRAPPLSDAVANLFPGPAEDPSRIFSIAYFLVTR